MRECQLGKKIIPLKKNKDNSYTLLFGTPKSSEEISIGFATDSNIDFETKFSPQSDYFNLQFFPESGSLVSGLTSKVGFKSLDVNGKGKPIAISNDKFIVTSNSHFKAEKALLHKEEWSIEAIPQLLFTTIKDSKTNEETEDFESNIQWTHHSVFKIDKAGPMRLSLEETFLHVRIYN